MFALRTGTVYVLPVGSVHKPRRDLQVLLALGVGLFFAALVAIGGVISSVQNGIQQTAWQPSTPKVLAATAEETSELDQATLETNDISPLVQNWVTNQKNSTWSVRVQPLAGNANTSARVEDMKQFQLASIYKLFLLEPLAKTIPSNKWATTMINEHSYGYCVIAMMSVSDNPCAEAIAERMGWQTVQKLTRAAGYQSTNFNHSDYIAGTTSDTATLLAKLYDGKDFDPIAREITLAGMLKTKKAEGIRRGCDGCAVYNKIGEIANVRHDVAIVEKNGRSYAVVIFSENGTWQQITELTRLISPEL